MEDTYKEKKSLKREYYDALVSSVLAILSGTVNLFIDGVLVARAEGADGLAAVNLCIPVYLLLCVVGAYWVSGCAIPATKKMGQQDRQEAVHYYQIACTFCFFTSLVIVIAGMLPGNFIVTFLCKEKGLADMVAVYAKITLIGAVPKMMLYVPFWFLRLDERNKEVTLMMIIMGASNILLDWVFMYILPWGVAGAAIASVIATFLACVMGFLFLCDKKSTFSMGIAKPENSKEFKEIAAAGSPSAMNNLLQTLRLLLVNGILLKQGGGMLVAVFGVINCISAFSESFVMGIPASGYALHGEFVGKKDSKGVRDLICLQWRSGVALGVLFSVGIIAGAPIIARLYGLEVSLYSAMLCLALSLFPAVWNTILAAWYNVSDHIVLSNVIVVLRVLVMTSVSLFILCNVKLCIWIFLPASEGLTVLFLFVITKRQSPKGGNCFLMLEE